MRIKVLQLLLAVKFTFVCAATLNEESHSSIRESPDGGDGSCELDGTLYPNDASIPRDHPCHYCLCIAANVYCYWKRCGPPPEGCTSLTYPGICNPSLFLCPIPERARQSRRRELTYDLSLFDSFDDRRFERDFAEDERLFGFGRRLQRRIRPRRSADESKLLPIEEPFPSHLMSENLFRRRRAINATVANAFVTRQPADKGCEILGVQYRLGDVIGVATDACMECRCAAQALYCSPKCCFEPSTPQLETKTTVRRAHGGLEDYETPLQRPLPHPLHYVRSEFADE